MKIKRDTLILTILLLVFAASVSASFGVNMANTVKGK